ncbi:tetratricopeptide repeat protein [Tautonia sociabilis]|uniref:tetratricopeptide repeat protein n=1 Tax=Tautonia sociabilis TaxID=2080755 RepID=UPI001315376F|nr:tetratricopeptide repeat protein [Tautonia sociabilis]
MSLSPRLPQERGRGPGFRIGRRAAVIAAIVLAIGAGLALLWPRPDPEAVWIEAQSHLQAGRIDEAERASERLSRLREPTERDWMLRAQVAIARNRTDEAIAILRRFPKQGELTPRALLLVGQLELRRDRLRSAERAFSEALELDPNLSQARRELIYIYGYRSQTVAMGEQFRGLAESGLLTADDTFLWSLSRGVQWTPEEIVDRLSTAVSAEPEDSASRIALADALLELNRFDEAAAILEPLDPADADARAALGRLALERGDVGLLAELLADAPEDHAGLALLRGKLALRRRDPEAAVSAYRRALELRPNDRDALSGLSQALNQAGHREEAAEAVARLTRINDLNDLLHQLARVDADRSPDRYVEIGSACEAIGLEAQARAWYQVALAGDPFHREAQAALGRMGRLGEEEAASDSGAE